MSGIAWPQERDKDGRLQAIMRELSGPEFGQLTELHLGSGELCQLPASVGQLVRLRSLDICNNPLSELPSSLSQLVRLTSLRVDGTALREFPAWIACWRRLAVLSALFCRKLSSLPPALGELSRLESLAVGHCALTTLPPSLGRLTSLTGLLLQRNQLDWLPLELGALTALSVFNPVGNRLPARYGFWSISYLTHSSTQAALREFQRVRTAERVMVYLALVCGCNRVVLAAVHTHWPHVN